MGFSAALLVLTATSCSTTSFLGLSRSSYVDEELARLNESAERIAAMEERVGQIDRLEGDVGELRREVDDMRESEREIRRMAEVFQTRLDELPEETLRELARAIEEYLDSDGGD